jgi:5-formyltetrahydrofolate cyclo-ligase
MTGNATVCALLGTADTTGAWDPDQRGARLNLLLMSQEIPSADLTKSELRRRMTAARRARSVAERSDAAARNGGHLADHLAGTPVVCAYLPLPTEPLATDLLDTLVASGSTVLVPVVTEGAPLDWCRYPAPTTAGAFGIAEPTGPRLGAHAIRSATAILVPALAVDRAGGRLGRGGGHYDRTLALLRWHTPQLVAVLFDGEILDLVPAEAHDIPVGAAVTPATGVSYFRR